MEKDVLNPKNWNAEQWEDALTAGALASFIFAVVMTVIYVFH